MPAGPAGIESWANGSVYTPLTYAPTNASIRQQLAALPSGTGVLLSMQVFCLLGTPCGTSGLEFAASPAIIISY